jgi:hypothetical protein
MKTMSKQEWNSIKEGKLDKDMTVEEFKAQFEISNEEYESALKTSMCNEYGTTDLFFNDEECDRLTAELSNEGLITHLYVS